MLGGHNYTILLYNEAITGRFAYRSSVGLSRSKLSHFDGVLLGSSCFRRGEGAFRVFNVGSMLRSYSFFFLPAVLFRFCVVRP